MGRGDMALTNKNIQAQRLIEPQIPLRASRVVKWWAAAFAAAEVNMACMFVVFTGSPRTTRTVENNSRFSAVQREAWKIG